MSDKKERFLDRKVNDLTVGETVKYTILVGGVSAAIYAGLALVGSVAEKVATVIRRKNQKPIEFHFDVNQENDLEE